MDHEITQQIVFFGRQFHFLAAAPHDVGNEVNLDVAKANHSLVGGGLGAAQKSLEPRRQFQRPEWFGQVVVRTQVERGDCLHFAVTHCQNQHRDLRPLPKKS